MVIRPQNSILGFFGTKTKRAVSFLKEIAPYWILGTCDIYDETAKSALIALNKVFEEKDKRKKFFKHVATDVIETLFNFVITETKESLTSMVGIPSEWTAADYEKHLESYFCSVQGSALKAMTLVLDVVGPEFDSHYEFINDVVYPCNTIWKFARSNTSDLPRAGFLNFLASSVKCVEKFGNLEKYKKHFTKFVLSQLNTEDSLVLPALLKIIPKILHLYSETELQKSYVPGLKFFFSKGGFGFIKNIQVDVHIAEEFVRNAVLANVCEGLQIANLVFQKEELNAMLAIFHHSMPSIEQVINFLANHVIALTENQLDMFSVYSDEIDLEVLKTEFEKAQIEITFEDETNNTVKVQSRKRAKNLCRYLGYFQIFDESLLLETAELYPQILSKKSVEQLRSISENDESDQKRLIKILAKSDGDSRPNCWAMLLKIIDYQGDHEKHVLLLIEALNHVLYKNRNEFYGIISAFLPVSELPIEFYKSCLSEEQLEKVFTESSDLPKRMASGKLIKKLQADDVTVYRLEEFNGLPEQGELLCKVTDKNALVKIEAIEFVPELSEKVPGLLEAVFKSDRIDKNWVSYLLKNQIEKVFEVYTVNLGALILKWFKPSDSEPLSWINVKNGIDESQETIDLEIFKKIFEGIDTEPLFLTLWEAQNYAHLFNLLKGGPSDEAHEFLEEVKYQKLTETIHGVSLLEFLNLQQSTQCLSHIKNNCSEVGTAPVAISALTAILSENLEHVSLAHEIAIETVTDLYEKSTSEDWYGLYLFDSASFDDSEKVTERFVFNSALCELFSLVIATDEARIKLKQLVWDWMQCSLVSWMDSLPKNGESGAMIPVSYTNSLVKLTTTMDSYLLSPSANTDPTLPSSLCTDWRGFFRKQVFTSWLEYFGNDPISSQIVHEIRNSIFDLNQDQIVNFSKKWVEIVDDETKDYRIQMSACSLFKTFKSEIKYDLFVNEFSFYSWFAKCYSGVKVETQEQRMELFNMLDHLVEIIPKTIAPSYLAELSKSKQPDIEHLAIECFRELLKTYPAQSRQWFNDNLDVKTQALVRGFVVANISEKIRKHELENIRQNRENSVDEDFTIKIIGDDVLCKYVFEGDDDIVLEMEIKLPNDYPVTAAKVNLSGKTGVDAKRERAWHFRLSVLLSKAEKSIIESLESWRKLVDIEFQGVEACAICYSVVFGGASGNTKELPKICCKQCNHKYHSKCIYKWFQTSNNNTCPLCRSPMIFS